MLLHYYVWFKNEEYAEVKILLGSTYFESLKDQYNFEKPFLNQLMNIFTHLNIDTEKLLKKLQPKIYKKFEEIKNNIISNYDDNDKRIVSAIFSLYKKLYLIQNIVYHRNQAVHSGDIKVKDTDPNAINGTIYNDLLKVPNLPNITFLSEKNIFLEDTFQNYIKKQFKGLNNVYKTPKITQELIIEDLIEITLLKLLKIKGQISKMDHLNQTNKETMIVDPVKEYLEKFTINNS